MTQKNEDGKKRTNNHQQISNKYIEYNKWIIIQSERVIRWNIGNFTDLEKVIDL